MLNAEACIQSDRDLNSVSSSTEKKGRTLLIFTQRREGLSAAHGQANLTQPGEKLSWLIRKSANGPTKVLRSQAWCPWHGFFFFGA